MATNSKSKCTVEIKCWKEHTCVGCGGVFRYRMKWQQAGEGPTEEAAEVAARKVAMDSVKERVEMYPCPSCGRYQPDMVADTHSALHTLLVVVLTIALGILLALFVFGYIPRDLVTWVALGLRPVALGHLRLVLSNPNRDLEANRQKAREAVEAKTLMLEEPGRPGQPLPRTCPQHLGVGNAFALLLLLLGIGLLASPEVVRLVSGWPTNRDCDPMIVGPGDSVTVHLPDEVASIRGLWSGEATVEVLNARELGLESSRLPAVSSSDRWGRVMFGKRLWTKSTRLWAHVEIPEAENLTGKTMRMQISLAVKYPAKHGLLGFREEYRTLGHTAEMHLASPHAGLEYFLLWWGRRGNRWMLVPMAGFLLSQLRRGTGKKSCRQPEFD